MSADTPVVDVPVMRETAAEHASTRVPLASPATTAGEVRRGLVGREFETASHIVVQEAGQFLGLLRIEALLTAPDDSLVGDLADREVPVVSPGVDQEVAAWRAVRNEETALPVVDADGRFVGIIPPQRLLGILLSEHEEDLTRLGGFLKSTSQARKTSTETVERRFRHRFPWLLVGLAGALLAADFVGRFESHLQETVMLAFFIPGIVYLADAVGTQTETIVVRGLSVGVTMRRMVRRELLAGLVIGFTLAAIAGPLVWWRWEDASVALAVGIALFAACSTATLAAMLLPWLFSVSGRDPAFGSGPLATVIQDLLSILIYFAIAAAVVR
jgi:magnesium transporter